MARKKHRQQPLPPAPTSSTATPTSETTTPVYDDSTTTTYNVSGTPLKTHHDVVIMHSHLPRKPAPAPRPPSEDTFCTIAPPLRDMRFSVCQGGWWTACEYVQRHARDFGFCVAVDRTPRTHENAVDWTLRCGVTAPDILLAGAGVEQMCSYEVQVRFWSQADGWLVTEICPSHNHAVCAPEEHEGAVDRADEHRVGELAVAGPGAVQLGDGELVARPDDGEGGKWTEVLVRKARNRKKKKLPAASTGPPSKHKEQRTKPNGDAEKSEESQREQNTNVGAPNNPPSPDTVIFSADTPASGETYVESNPDLPLNESALSAEDEDTDPCASMTEETHAAPRLASTKNPAGVPAAADKPVPLDADQPARHNPSPSPHIDGKSEPSRAVAKQHRTQPLTLDLPFRGLALRPAQTVSPCSATASETENRDATAEPGSVVSDSETLAETEPAVREVLGPAAGKGVINSRTVRIQAWGAQRGGGAVELEVCAVAPRENAVDERLEEVFAGIRGQPEEVRREALVVLRSLLRLVGRSE